MTAWLPTEWSPRLASSHRNPNLYLILGYPYNIVEGALEI
jgi:hypothetical protein